MQQEVIIRALVTRLLEVGMDLVSQGLAALYTSLRLEVVRILGKHLAQVATI